MRRWRIAEATRGSAYAISTGRVTPGRESSLDQALERTFSLYDEASGVPVLLANLFRGSRKLCDELAEQDVWAFGAIMDADVASGNYSWELLDFFDIICTPCGHPIREKQELIMRILTSYLSALNLLARAAKKAVFTVPVSLVSVVLRNR